MKKTFLIILISCFSTIVVFSQNDTVKYEVLRDNPDEIPNLYLSLVPLNLNLTGGIYTNFGANMQWNIIDRINLRANYEMQYPISFDDLFLINSALYDFEYHSTNFQNIELGLDFTISDNSRLDDGTVLLRSNSVAGTNVTVVTNEVIQTKVKHRRINRVRLGAMQYKLNFQNQNESITTTDGTVFKVDEIFGGVQFPDIVYDSLLAYSWSTDLHNEFQYSDINCNLKTEQKISVIYLGFSINSIKNKVIKAQDYGLRGIVSYTSFYFDVMIGKSELQAFQFYNSNPNASLYGEEIGTTLIDYMIDVEASGLKFNPLGLRFGYSIKRPLFSKLPTNFADRTKRVEKPIYLSYSTQAGFIPSYGIKRGLFLTFGIAIDINPF